jgi:hypothetical protein
MLYSQQFVCVILSASEVGMDLNKVEKRCAVLASIIRIHHTDRLNHLLL